MTVAATISTALLCEKRQSYALVRWGGAGHASGARARGRSGHDSSHLTTRDPNLGTFQPNLRARARIRPRHTALLQTTIRTALRGCSVITIAHRLSAIADYDRVLVLSDGHVADFDAPSALLALPASLLRQLVDALGKAGAASFERLVALADENRRSGGGDAVNVRRYVELAGAAAVYEGAADPHPAPGRLRGRRPGGSPPPSGRGMRLYRRPPP
ncbi:hypothetical protein I4F81_000730 [Pyropia yezoensis]|uniref:Uncharacterized protein n=1 Tax=Pyropia yezoensis TaxID=2788 RepID=A0ACC3BKV0_PYRYE|nr:hypothetical protein I4F81_000730 [Neopyropia yezoensis]